MILRNQDTPKILRIKQIKAQTGLPNCCITVLQKRCE